MVRSWGAGGQAVGPVSCGHFCHHQHVVIESGCLDRSWRCPASRRLSALLPAVTSHPPIRDWLWGLHEALRCRQKDLSARYNILIHEDRNPTQASLKTKREFISSRKQLVPG